MKLDFKGLKIDKETIEKHFPREDITGYESPLTVVTSEIANTMAKMIDENIWQATVRTEIDVDKDELIKALKYDRDQYDRGYINGYNAGLDSILKCKDCEFWDRENIEMHTRCTGDDTLAEFAECFRWSNWSVCRLLRFDDYCSCGKKREDEG